MPIPASWVEQLHARLQVRYGVAFARQYEDLDPELVKSDWADVLDGFDRASIAYALRFLPAERPPTALQFRDQCRRAPRGDAVASLPPPADRADPERVRALLATLRIPSEDRRLMSPAEWCARNIRRLAAERGSMSPAQKAQLEACERICGDTSGRWVRPAARAQFAEET